MQYFCFPCELAKSCQSLKVSMNSISIPHSLAALGCTWMSVANPEGGGARGCAPPPFKSALRYNKVL